MGLQVWVVMPITPSLPGVTNTWIQPTLHNYAKQAVREEKARIAGWLGDFRQEVTCRATHAKTNLPWDNSRQAESPTRQLTLLGCFLCAGHLSLHFTWDNSLRQACEVGAIIIPSFHSYSSSLTSVPLLFPFYRRRD